MPMNTYLVLYDLKNGDETQYKQLHSAIATLGKAEWLEYSNYIVVSSKTEIEIRDYLSPFIRTIKGDTLFVAKFNAYASLGIAKDKVNVVDSSWNADKLIKALSFR